MAHSDILSQPDRGLGLDRPQTEALLALFSRCDDLREFGREVIQSVVNALMDSQAQEACGAPRGSRSPERVNMAARASAPAPAPEPLEGERLEAVRLAAHEVIREVLDRHGVAE